MHSSFSSSRTTRSVPWGRSGIHASSSSAHASPAKANPRRRPVAERILLSKVLRDTPNAAEPNKISVVERFITEVDTVPDKFRDVEVLFLSHNCISTFAGFSQFRRLRVLSLASNCIDRFSEIESLSKFPQLQILNLEGNSVTVSPNYRLHVITRLPRLKMLDNREVRPSEREAAPRAVAAEAEQMRVLFSNSLLERKLSGASQRILMHSELLTIVHSGRFSRGRAPPSPPTTCSMDTRRYLEYIDLEGCVSSSERDSVLDQIRSEVRRMRVEQGQRLDAASNSISGSPLRGGGSAYDMYQTMLASTPRSEGGGRRSQVPEWMQWEAASKAVIAIQQGRITRAMTAVHDARIEFEARRSALSAQGGLRFISEEEEEQERYSPPPAARSSIPRPRGVSEDGGGIPAPRARPRPTPMLEQLRRHEEAVKLASPPEKLSASPSRRTTASPPEKLSASPFRRTTASPPETRRALPARTPMGGLKESIEAMFDSTTRVHGAEQVLESSDVARRMSPSSRAQRLLDMTPGDGSREMFGGAGGGGGGGRGGAGVELLEAEILRLTQEGERMCEKLVLAQEEAKRSEEKAAAYKTDTEAKLEEARKEAEMARRQCDVRVKEEGERLRPLIEMEVGDAVRKEERVAAEKKVKALQERADERCQASESKVKALQGMVHSISSSEAGIDNSLRRQLADATEKVVALEERLEASKADTEFLSGVLKDTEHRCSELQKAIGWREAADEGWERAHNLHDLLVSRRALLRWGRNCRDRREGAKVEGAAAGLGDNLIKARWMRRFAKAASLSRVITAMRRRNETRRIARAEACARTTFEAYNQRFRGFPSGSAEAAVWSLSSTLLTAGTVITRVFHLWRTCARWSVQAVEGAHVMSRALDAALESRAVRVWSSARGVRTATDRIKNAFSRRFLRAWRGEEGGGVYRGGVEARFLLFGGGGGGGRHARAAFLESLPVGGADGRWAMAVACKHDASRVLRTSLVELSRRVRHIRSGRLGQGLGEGQAGGAITHGAGWGSRASVWKLRALRDWKDAVVGSRILGRAGELARRMRAGRLLQGARVAMHSWREVAIARGRWRRGAGGIEVRRELLLMRQIWTWWIAAVKMTVVQGRSKAEREAMEEREARMREEERSRDMDMQNIELIEKVQELQSGKLRADAGMVDQASALEELQAALRESAVIEQELRAEMELRSARERKLSDRNGELEAELNRHQDGVEAATTRVSLDRQGAAQMINMLEGKLAAVRGEMGRIAEDREEMESKYAARGMELAEARRALEEAMSGLMARGSAGSSGAPVMALGERDARENSAAFTERRRQIDEEFRARIAEAPSSHQITAKHRGEVGRAMAIGGTGNRQYEENVFPQGDAGGEPINGAQTAGGSLSVSGPSKPLGGGVTASSSVSVTLNSPGSVGEAHRQEMASLHDEIEALQSRILGRLNAD